MSRIQSLGVEHKDPDTGDVSRLDQVVEAGKHGSNLKDDWADNARSARGIGRQIQPLRTLLRDWDFTDEMGCNVTGNPFLADANTAIVRQALARYAERGYGILRPRGTVQLNALTPLTFADQCGIEGEYRGKSGVLLNRAANGNFIELGHSGFVTSAHIGRAGGTGYHTSGAAISAVDKNDINIEGNWIRGHYGLTEVRSTVSNMHGGVTIIRNVFGDVTPSAEAAGSYAIWTDRLFSLHVENNTTGSAYGWGNPSFGWRIGAGNSIMDINNNLTGLSGLGLSRMIDPDDELLSLTMLGGDVDGAPSGLAASCLVKPRVGGRVIMLRASCVEFGNAVTGAALSLDGTDGLIDSIELANCAIIHNGAEGIKAKGGVARSSTKGIGHLKMIGGNISGCGTDGLWLDQYVAKTLMRGVTAGEISGSGPAYYGGNGAWGVNGSSANSYDIEVFGTGNGLGLCNLADNGGTQRVVARAWA
ncbi:hypothetical protein [Caulobacter sp. BK020]|uniref:hypothetical protein n=1 Tax=Caulobacter sp. BK020 TaxID=2512117 RepID=UPI0010458521|nr:hypothetical protein [Caulobacter sp. BK020]TCS14537.1 hypothetical protein EV278_107186 [Caulobacter sp. BK020]